VAVGTEMLSAENWLSSAKMTEIVKSANIFALPFQSFDLYGSLTKAAIFIYLILAKFCQSPAHDISEIAIAVDI